MAIAAKALRVASGDCEGHTTEYFLYSSCYKPHWSRHRNTCGCSDKGVVLKPNGLYSVEYEQVVAAM
ncbi:hypothetical protein PI125_g16371 [Phytophthora idaei]|nr:hypothetical protein PI125_g16371 [Phytophthora idaei]